MRRSSLLSLLICVNLILLTAVLLVAVKPPAALAQATGLSGNYMMVAGEIQDQYDALYIVDLRERTLHVFYFDRGKRDLMYADYRDLERDFRHNRD